MTVPFENPNSRIFYACQAVFLEERNTENEITDPTVNSVFLDGVQSVGVSSDNPSRSLTDIGRFQKKYTQYSQQTIDITLERAIPKGSDFFYHVDPLQYINYTQSHFLNSKNFGSKGAKDNDDNTLRNYDITILYGPDQFSRFYDGVDNPSGIEEDPDARNVISVTYPNCLITSIDYSIGVSGITESISLRTRNIRYNDNYSDTTQYNWPTEYTNATVSDRTGESGGTLRRQDLDLTVNSPGQYGETKLPREVKELFNFDTPVIEGPDLQVLGIQSINIGVSIDYTDIADVGNWRGSENSKEHEQNRWSVVNLPVSVTCSFTGVPRQYMPYSNFLTGAEKKVRNVDNVYNKSIADGTSTEWQDADCEIRIIAKGNESPQDYFVWDLGVNNYLTSIEYSGGETGGGNVEATISYSNQYSDFVATKTNSVIDLNTTNNGPY